MSPRHNSHILERSCQAVFVEDACAGMNCNSSAGVVDCRDSSAALAAGLVREQLSVYQKNMKHLVETHPELLELLKKRDALAKKLEAVRKKKSQEKFAFWD
ncbi:MAG: hypothetical protein WDO12_12255 [Pseudomonadota bacterium]